MGFLTNLFGAKEKKISSFADFWKWFIENQDTFHKIVRTKNVKEVEDGFLRRLAPKLNELKDGIFYLVGMLDDSTAELVLTADGNPKNIVFVEELVEAAPEITGWQITPLKQPMNIDSFGLTMNGYDFNTNNLSFYQTDHSDMPDLVDITIVHKDLNDANEQSLENGVYVFLDNYLGELSFLENIDELSISGPSDVDGKLIPIDALENYLQTRKALFVEKYHGVRVFTENDAYSLMQAELDMGRIMVATVNTDLLNWDKKASHPWMLVFTICYDGDNFNGMPDSATAERLDEIEDTIGNDLTDVDGYLNVGRQSANNERHIFFACVDFREPSRVAYKVQRQYKESFSLDYEIYKDKYWRSVAHLMPSKDEL